MRNRVGQSREPASATRSCRRPAEGGRAAHLLVGPCQLLFQGGNSLQGRSEPLPHLLEARRDGGRHRDPTGLRLQEPGLDLPALGMRQREGPAKRHISEREPNRGTWKLGRWEGGPVEKLEGSFPSTRGAEIADEGHTEAPGRRGWMVGWARRRARPATFSSRALWCSNSDLRAFSTSTSLETPEGNWAWRFTTVIRSDRSWRDTRHSRCSRSNWQGVGQGKREGCEHVPGG